MPRYSDSPDISAKLEAYRQKLLSVPVPKPKPTEAEKAAVLRERLGRVEMALDKTDAKRVHLLLKAARYAADQEDYQAVHGYAAEVALLCRSKVLGVREAHPIMSTLPPPAPARLSSPVEVVDEPQG